MNVVEIENLIKRFGKQLVLNGLSLTLEEGFVLGLVGENGVGKTTLIRTLLNLSPVGSGLIRIFGLDHREKKLEVRLRIEFVHEESYLHEGFRLRDIETIVSRAYPKWSHEQFRGYLKRMDLPDNTRIKSFSKGMKMRASLAIALSHEAELILLDEPTSGLVPVVRNDLYSIIREKLFKNRRSFIISTHITSDLEQVAAFVALLRDGKTALQISIKELMVYANSQIREDYHESATA